tara:strand:- start:1334 stop:1534 length:201 start_codon:yes stop_codon:yes gene_type:complete
MPPLPKPSGLIDHLKRKAVAMPDKQPVDDKKTPDLKDVEPGSDADATPIAEPGETPPEPEGNKLGS